MIGYKCNVCGDKISENKYNNLKEKNDLECLECGKGYYESHFEDEGNISSKLKDIMKKSDSLPGATKTNRTIGAVIGALLGGIVFQFFGIIVGGIAGYYFAPHYVPKLRKIFNKIKSQINFRDKDDDFKG